MPIKEFASTQTVETILADHKEADTREFEATANEFGVSKDKLAQFEAFLHEDPAEVLPYLHEQARELIDTIYLSVELHKPPTPYYNHLLYLLPKDQAITALAGHLGGLEIINHPLRQEIRNYIESKPYMASPQTEIPLLERAQEERLALAFDDIALDLKPDPDPEKARTKRNPLLAHMWTRVGKHVRLPWCGSSMPVCTGDPWSVAISAQSGMLVMIPRDAHYADVEIQVQCYKDATELIDMPYFPLHNDIDYEELILFHKRNIGATIEPNPAKGLKRARELWKAGCRTFRVYGPEGATLEMIDTVKVLRIEFGNEAEIFVGQVLDSNQAIELQDAGADGLYTGVGGGGICDTPGEASVAYLLLQTLYDFKKSGISIPYIAEGGVGRNLPIVLALGGSAASKSDAIYGGTIESPGGFVFMQDERGLYKPYAGEASAATKQLNGKLDRLGKPMFIEGVAGKTYFKKDFPSVPYRVYTMMQSLATALVFARERTIDGLRTSKQISFWQNTPESSHTRSTHH